MSASKLAFIHRLLWARSGLYRTAVLLGPPPLIGCALAAWVWFAVRPGGAPPKAEAPPWARQDRPVPQEDQPYAETPAAKLPQSRPGGYAGFQTGWHVTVQPVTVDATMDANVAGTILARFDIDRPDIALSSILDAGPPKGLFVGVARSFLVVRTAGLYAVSIRLQRSAAQSANCLVRLASGKHRLVRNIALNTNGDAVLTYTPAALRFDPGLYFMAVAVGCWRGDQMAGAGDVSLLIRHPGETTLMPARADEVIKPASKTSPQ